MGYTRMTWDARSPASVSKYWSQLTDVEQEAAEAFGYSERSWDNESGEEKQPHAASTLWDKLKTKKKVALKVLGYTRASWDSQKPPSYYAYWEELTEDERAAAGLLGYNNKIWDNISGNVKQPASAKKKWTNLTDEEKAALMVLDYNERSWDSKPGLPDAATKFWSDLTVCGEDTCIAPLLPRETNKYCFIAMNPASFLKSVNLLTFLPVCIRLNSRQAAKTNEMQHVSWDLILIHGIHLECTSPLPLKKLGSR